LQSTAGIPRKYNENRVERSWFFLKNSFFAKLPMNFLREEMKTLQQNVLPVERFFVFFTSEKIWKALFRMLEGTP